MFENDVKIYGIQTTICSTSLSITFENDVKIYGIQTRYGVSNVIVWFENDVKIYGIQTYIQDNLHHIRLRMM